LVDCQDGQPKKQRNDIVVVEPDSIEAADRQKYNEGMLRRQAFKYELMPNGEQQRAMRRFAGSCRFVFNKALALQQANHQTGEKFIGYVAMAKRLTEWRNGRETPTSRARKDFLHKTTTTISQNHALVCIEDLQVRNMSRSSKGTSERPGKRVSQKSGLNRAILDQGWAEFRRQLEYKMQWAGGMLLAVPAHHTSQTCPSCGHVAAENRSTQAQFLCVACEHTAHADLVGAINVLERGQRLLACGEDGSGRSRKTTTQPASAKQEPTEATMPEASLA